MQPSEPRTSDEQTAGAIRIRPPHSTDGSAVWSLIARTTTLDDNSMYCNLLQCSDFSETCALAERDGQIVGWVSGYIPPNRPGTLFVWQICVDEAARGQGLAKRLLAAVLGREACRDVTQVESTITEANAASWALFGSLAQTLGAELARKPHFERKEHFAGRHDTEFLVSIGPFQRQALSSAA